MVDDEFQKELVKVLGDMFKHLNYKFCDSCFFLNRDDGFRNIVSFDFDGENSYRIFIGIDYPYDQIVDDGLPPEGARLSHFFTGGSLSGKPTDFVFKNTFQLQCHLDRFKTYFLNKIQDDFFGAVQTPEDYADNLPEVECIVKYEIYKKEVIPAKAVREAKIILENYKNMLDIPKIKTFIEEDVEVFIRINGEDQ
jgi:hypothetical protein